MFDTNKIGNLLSSISRWVQDIKCSAKLAANSRFFEREICIQLSDTVIKAYAILEIREKSSKIIRIELLNGLQVINPQVIHCACCGSEGGSGGSAVTTKEFTISTTDPEFDTINLPVIPGDVLLVFRDTQQLIEGAGFNGYTVSVDTITLSEPPNVTGGEVTYKVIYV